MTKYILHGGNAQKQNDLNDSFFKEILKDTPENLNVLLVHFASDPSRAQLNKEKDSSQFIRNKGNKRLIFTIADVNKFESQIAECDIVYLSGGYTSKLLSTMQKFGNLKKQFTGKIVAGESAGANCLSAWCYSPFNETVYKGLGHLPIVTIPHYEKGTEKKISKIDKKIKRVLLPNYHFETFTV